MLKCLIVLCVGTLVVVVKSAPAPQTQSPIDFLLDLNQDVVEQEVPASVKPISQAQVGTTTEKNGREPAPVFEDQEADVQEIPREPAPTASQLNKDRDQGEDQEDVHDQGEDQDDREDDDRSDSEDESEQKDQQSASKDDDQDTKEEDKEDTTIRVYGPEDDETNEQQENKQKDQDQESDLRKVEPELHSHPQDDTRQPEEVTSEHADTVKQFDEAGTDLLQEVDHQVTIPEITSEQPNTLDERQEIEVKPDQLFNHGSIVFDKSTFTTDEDLPTTTPFSGKKWNHDHGPPGFGPWHPKFPGFPGNNHEHEHDHEGRPPFFGMPPFNGPPPQFDGPPPQWHLHNHSHDQRDWHRDHGFHGHGFHRRGPWKWNRS